MKLEEFHSHLVQPYYILSHRWEEEEMTYQEMVSGDGRQKKGYRKIRAFCDTIRMRNQASGPKFVWVDTCCIDKKSSAELSEAINSMYTWYQNAVCCYVFLSDVETLDDLESSLWFTRSWTLQELIAPSTVEFYNKAWWFMGSRKKLAREIAVASGIDHKLLTDNRQKNTYSIAQRMSWAAEREATRPEDKAYSLMGLFDVNMPMLYGEGSKAFTRLQEEIIRQNNDHTIFAWTMPASSRGQLQLSSMLSESPYAFKDCKDVIRTTPLVEPEEYSVTNLGIRIRLLATAWKMDIHCAFLECTMDGISTHCLGVYLWRSPITQLYARVILEEAHPVLIERQSWYIERARICPKPRLRKFLVRQDISHTITDNLYGFCLGNILAPTKTGCMDTTDIVAYDVWDPIRRIAHMQPGSAGTVCVIGFNSEEATVYKSIRLGFDDNFHAVVEISRPLRFDVDPFSSDWLIHASNIGGHISMHSDDTTGLMAELNSKGRLVLRVSRDVGLALWVSVQRLLITMEWKKMVGRNAMAWHVACEAE